MITAQDFEKGDGFPRGSKCRPKGKLFGFTQFSGPNGLRVSLENGLGETQQFKGTAPTAPSELKRSIRFEENRSLPSIQCARRTIFASESRFVPELFRDSRGP
jgi:hypothetical protein